MALLIVFLAGADKTSSSLSCKIIASFIQYFMLTTFCWMAVEAANIYKACVEIFGGESQSKFLMKASLFAWGMYNVYI